MSVEQLPMDFPPAALPRHIEILLDESAEALEVWQGDRETHSFVPADYVLIYDALCALRPRMPAAPRFLEWGSGLGIAAMLAASLGWEAAGIEREEGLVRESRRFSELFDLPLRLHAGSFFPGEPNTVEKLAEMCGKADLIYVYPWPDQEIEIFDLFNRLASPGAFLLTYYGLEDVRVFQKC